MSKTKPTRFYGIDGEGMGRKPHRYRLLAASSELGVEYYVQAERGKQLTTVECLDFILALPKRAKVFAYSFTYDLTKILEDLPNDLLYRLLHPELRVPKTGKFRAPRAVLWEGYRLNLVSTKFTVQRGKRRVVVWDVWRFFGCAFVAALDNWGIERSAAMADMKAQRGKFSRLSDTRIRGYCFEECRCLARLVRALVNAHAKAGYILKRFYGAGSTAAVVLDSLGIKSKRSDGPPRMQRAIAQAFFGGRFEVSRVGAVPGRVWGYDISSAYPYQLTRLPCLLHGSWKWTERRTDILKARAALVRYGHSAPQTGPWAPFPFREPNGTITFPATSGGGYVWRDEYLAGERLGGIEFRGAWVLRQACKCPRPFTAIGELYRRRVELGKDGAGIVLKLGANSVYGKLAQSVGERPPYQCWIWAGMITSGCRAQILELITQHRDPSKLLMIATDGIYTRERLDPLPIPEPTGTADLAKPLGGWEEECYRKGVFCVRPGVYFPHEPTKAQLKAVRARGIGKAKLLDRWRLVVKAHEAGKREVQLTNIERFAGALSSLHKSRAGVSRAPTYGQWVRRELKLSFDAEPKRREALQPGGLLQLKRYPSDAESAPYDSAVVSAEASELIAAQLMATEQPDLSGF